MLSMQEINRSLKENFQTQLQDIKDLPEDLAVGYKNWVRGVIKQAAQQLQADAQSNQQEQQPQQGAQ